MEKLTYCLWKPEGMPTAEFRAELLGSVADDLERGGAQRLRVFVADDDVRAGDRLRLTAEATHKEAFVTFWLESSQDREAHEARLTRAAARLTGYLVVESKPIVNENLGTGRGGRTPGWVQVTGIVPKPGLPYSDFIHHWYTTHRQVAIDTQSTTGYVRNEIVRPLTDGAPRWAAIVEETFPAGALDDPHIFYDAQGSKERFEQNAAKMLESVQAFLDLSKVDAHPMSEFVFSA